MVEDFTTDIPGYSTTHEIMKILHIPQSEVYDQIKNKKIKAVRIGPFYLIPNTELPKLIKNNST